MLNKVTILCIFLPFLYSCNGSSSNNVNNNNITGCPTGKTDCNGTCYDLDSDNDHCGACDNSCSANETCIDRECIDPNAQPCNPTNCDGCCEGDTCRDGTSENACGEKGDLLVRCVHRDLPVRWMERKENASSPVMPKLVLGVVEPMGPA
ncbi:MAG: hypothetical protein PF689_02740 [Deltaproteobacteria bacterium]|nr:hypothetical protein [Deltaproteobacteria bacterium]